MIKLYLCFCAILFNYCNYAVISRPSPDKDFIKLEDECFNLLEQQLFSVLPQYIDTSELTSENKYFFIYKILNDFIESMGQNTEISLEDITISPETLSRLEFLKPRFGPESMRWVNEENEEVRLWARL